MKTKSVSKLVIPVLSSFLVLGSLAPNFAGNNSVVEAAEQPLLTKELFEKVDQYVELELSDAPYDEILPDGEFETYVAEEDEWNEPFPYQPGKPGKDHPTTNTSFENYVETSSTSDTSKSNGKYYRYTMEDVNMTTLENELTEEELKIVVDQLISSNNDIRETDFVDASVNGNVLSYVYEEQTEENYEPGDPGPSYGDCDVKQEYCPTDLGLGDPELGETGLDIRWDGFTISLSEAVTGTILGATGTSASNATITEFLKRYFIAIPSKYLRLTASLLTAYGASVNAFDVIGKYNYDPYLSNWEYIEYGDGTRYEYGELVSD